jgi:hypothetical protein
MKKILTLTFILSLIATTNSFAQTSFGIKAGISSSSWKGDAMNSLGDLVELTNGYVTTDRRTGFYAGGFAEIPITEVLSIEPGVYYSQKGYSLRGDLQIDKLSFLGASATAQVQSHYIDVPVLIKANVGGGLQLYGGPQVSVLAKNNLHVEAGALGISVFQRNLDITNQFNPIDFSVVGGIGYQFENGLSINGSYDHGLSRLDKNSNFKSYNRAFKVGLGFRF